MSATSAFLTRPIRTGILALLSAMLLIVVTAPAQAVPPANDNFASATNINVAALPYSNTVNVTEATTEPAESFYCTFTTQTVWYRIAPSSDVWLNIGMPSGQGILTLWRDGGFGLNGLQIINCTSSPGTLPTQLVRAGQVFYAQSSAYCCGISTSLSINVQQVPAPVPVAGFSFYPSDPSTFDTIGFFDSSYDPGGQGFSSQSYDFGDGSSSSDSSCCTSHRYAADGDYTVIHSVRTTDGRADTTARVVNVRTHDVAITNFKVPQSGNLGQTRQVIVTVSNTRYPEQVRVDLLRGVPGQFSNFVQVGYLEQFVQVRSGNRGTDFQFSYTITPDDIKNGKVTLKAVATIVNGRDALSADNEAISEPIRTGRTGGIVFTEEWTEAAGEPALEFGLLAITPNPVRRGAELSLRLSLAREGEASVQVLDIAGRVMASRELGRLPAGVHDARLAWNRPPSAGIYWVRLTQAGEEPQIRRVAVLD